MRDEVVDFVRRWSAKSEIRGARFVAWLDISTSKFYNWRKRYGKVNEHNAWIPRERWLEQWEKQVILDFHREHPLEGYRRLSYMMLDADKVAVSPSSVWRVLSQACVLAKWNKKRSSKDSGFEQPSKAHEHWHINISYINIRRHVGGHFARWTDRKEPAREATPHGPEKPGAPWRRVV